MSAPASAEALSRLAEAVAAAGPGGVVCAVGFGREIANSVRLERRLGARTRVVRVGEPTLPPGGLWLAVARSLGASGSGDPRRRARRAVADELRERRATVILVSEAERLPAASLASLLSTAESEPGLGLLLFEATEGQLAVPLPTHAVTVRPAVVAGVVPPAGARPAASRATSSAPRASAPAARGRPGASRAAAIGGRESAPWIAAVGLALLLIGGGLWWGVSGEESSGTIPEPATQPATVPAAAAELRDTGADLARAPDPAPSVAPAGASPRNDPVVPPPPSSDPPAPLAPSAALLSGPINLNADPWATIEIEGRSLGETPIGNLRLPRGDYEVRAIFPDGTSQVRHVVADGNEQYVSFRP